MTPSSPHDAAPPGWQAFLASLSPLGVGAAIALGGAAAVLLTPIFETPFPVLLGRTLFLAVTLLLAHAAARAWPRAWGLRMLPGWLARIVAIAAAAPLATLAIYLSATGGDFGAFVQAKGRVSGFLWITGTGLVLGILTALGAMVRERDAQARSLALQFALERSQLEKQALDARLALLQAQIEPHFLFNTLANVQALVDTGSPRASAVLRSLVAYLRAALPRLHDAQPPLGNEVALVRAYLELMQMRMPDRLRYTIDVDPALESRRFPPMALLTLVENAVRHGIDPSESGGSIAVGARAGAASSALRLWVEDSGRGLDPHAAPGTGLANLRARLQAVFGPGARLELHERRPHGVRAEIVIADADAAA